MKKMFLAALTALALCSYSYAQDEDEYEEDDAPARVVKKAPVVEDDEEEEEAAPAPKKVEKKASKSAEGGAAFFGAGIDVGGLLNNAGNIRLVFKLGESMELSGILGFRHHGQTTAEDNNGNKQDFKDNYTELSIGAGFDFFVVREVLPVSVGGEIIYTSPYEMETPMGRVNADDDTDLMKLDFNVLLGGHAELVKNLILTGKIGLNIEYNSASVNNQGDASYIDFGLATKVYLTWFMF